MAEVGVGVQGDLRVEAQGAAPRRLRHRVDLDQRGVLRDERLPQPDRDVDHLVADLGREAGQRRDLAGERLVDALTGVDRDLGDLLGRLVRHLLDLHAAGHAGDAQERPVRPVEQVGEVVLLGDVRGRGEHDLVDRVALDVHAEDVPCAGLGLVGVPGQLHPAGLAAAADLDLGLDDDPAAESLRDGPGLGRGGGDPAAQHRQPVPGEQLAPLVLVQVHVARPVSVVLDVPVYREPGATLFRPGADHAKNRA